MIIPLPGELLLSNLENYNFTNKKLKLNQLENQNFISLKTIASLPGKTLPQQMENQNFISLKTIASLPVGTWASLNPDGFL